MQVPETGRWRARLASAKSLREFLCNDYYSCAIVPDEAPRLFRSEHLLVFDADNFKRA